MWGPLDTMKPLNPPALKPILFLTFLLFEIMNLLIKQKQKQLVSGFLLPVAKAFFWTQLFFCIYSILETFKAGLTD